jgi:hypothetical protein
VAAGPVFILPIIKYWLKDTNMLGTLEEIEGTAVQTEQQTNVEPQKEKYP